MQGLMLAVVCTRYAAVACACRFAYFDLEGTGEITVQNLVKIFGSEEHAREIMGKHTVSCLTQSCTCELTTAAT
eukprot:6062-Heterococcus_DN1.PRE.1